MPSIYPFQVYPLTQRLIAAAAALLLGAWCTWQFASAQLPAPANSSLPTSTTSGPATLPQPVQQPLDPSQRGSLVNAGTNGLPLNNPVTHGSVTLAILGDLAPTNAASAKYLQQAIRELNLLRPDAVLTVGNLLDRMPRAEESYIQQTLTTRKTLDTLTMPWYPCAGTFELYDPRMAPLYERYLGPRYYSLDAGDVHVIVLDSLDNRGRPGIGDTQRAWLKADLARTFDLRRALRVVVLLHRPLWNEEIPDAADWARVHSMLLDFNRKPIVRVERPGTPTGGGTIGPKVVGVFAGQTRAYTQDPSRDGIGYWRLGATSAQLPQDAAVLLRHYTLLHFDAASATPTIALVQLGGGILPADTFLADERQTLDKLIALDDSSLGLLGTVDQPVGQDSGKPAENGPLKLHLANPLEVPITVEVRLASTRNLSTPTQRENANPYTENFDSAWQLFTPYTARHLKPGVQERWSASLYCPQQTGEVPPPQLEFVVRWNDARANGGRTHTVILKRRIPLIPRADLPPQPRVDLQGTTGWTNAYRGSTYAWSPSMREHLQNGPDWSLTADATHVFLRVSMTDDKESWLAGDQDPTNLQSDALSIAWASAPDSPSASVQRITVLPFAPPTQRLWTNTDVGTKQSKLAPLDPQKHPVEIAEIVRRKGTYEITLALPRKLLLSGPAESCLLNISVHDNDGGRETLVRSWARDDTGPATWGKISIKSPPPATAPAN